MISQDLAKFDEIYKIWQDWRYLVTFGEIPQYTIDPLSHPHGFPAVRKSQYITTVLLGVSEVRAFQLPANLLAMRAQCGALYPS